jgi:hypothetical protein
MSLESSFPGFTCEKQTWDFPVVLDHYVHQLSGSEFKVLWYILRHTFGWQKTADTICYEQFIHGIRRKEACEDENCEHQECWVDRGTGLDRKTICTTLQSLEQKGFILVHRGNRGKHEINGYSPKLAEFAGLLSGKIPPREVGKSHLAKWENSTLQSLTNIQSLNINNKDLKPFARVKSQTLAGETEKTAKGKLEHRYEMHLATYKALKARGSPNGESGLTRQDILRAKKRLKEMFQDEITDEEINGTMLALQQLADSGEQWARHWTMETVGKCISRWRRGELTHRGGYDSDADRNREFIPVRDDPANAHLYDPRIFGSLEDQRARAAREEAGRSV